MTIEKTKIMVEATIQAPVNKVWTLWNSPEHIVKWNCPSPDWHTPKASHNLVTGGTFLFRMEAKDGSFGFDFGGTYDNVQTNERIDYTLGDGRKVQNTFIPHGDKTKVVTTFDAETVNPIEQQRSGWQAILDSFKNYTESFV